MRRAASLTAARGAGRTGRIAFALLFALMVVNYIDRQVVVAMFGPLKAAYGATDAQLGLLVSIVSVAVAICALPLSMLADRIGRVRSIAAMAIVWSLATIAGAFAQGYGALLATRALVGVGEAAFGAVAVALLASLHPERHRSTVLGGFFAASILGTMLGIGPAGSIVARWGWPAAFVVAGLPGIVIALGFLVVMRGHRDEGASAAQETPTSALAMLTAVLRPRTLRWVCLGAGLQLVPVAMMYAWLPSWLSRARGIADEHAGFLAATFVLASGVGVVAWGWLADRAARQSANGRLIVSASGAVLTCVLLTPAFGLLGAGSLQLALILAGGVAMMASVGPMSSVVLDVVPTQVRATGASVLAVVQNLLGLAAGPLLAGLLSDRYGLTQALAIMPMLCLPAALCFALACRSHVADRRRAASGPGTAPAGRQAG